MKDGCSVKRASAKTIGKAQIQGDLFYYSGSILTSVVALVCGIAAVVDSSEHNYYSRIVGKFLHDIGVGLLLSSSQSRGKFGCSVPGTIVPCISSNAKVCCWWKYSALQLLYFQLILWWLITTLCWWKACYFRELFMLS